jgi:hypothetical protein
MRDVKTVRKIHLIFDQDDNGNLHLSTAEGSMSRVTPKRPGSGRLGPMNRPKIPLPGHGTISLTAHELSDGPAQT